MARNVDQLTKTTSIVGTDLFHFGRPTDPVNADKDRAITGGNLFNTMNRTYILYGGPTAPNVLVAGVPNQLLNFPSQHNASTSDDHIALIGDGTYRVSGTISWGTTSNGFDAALWAYINGGSPVIIAGTSIASRAGAGDLITLTGNTPLTLSNGDLISLWLESSISLSISDIVNAVLEVTPLALG